LPETRPKPLASWLPERSIYIASTSKCMAPGLRIGMVHAPASLLQSIADVIRMSCWMPAPLMAEIVHRWICDGTADELHANLRVEMRARCDSARAILGNRVAGQDGTRSHLWLALPEPWSEGAFRDAAFERGVRIATSETFAAKPGHAPGGVRLALGCEPDRRRLEAGLRTIGALLASAPRAALIV
jgi:DNA-binding transcriptional MocR family regulator